METHSQLGNIKTSDGSHSQKHVHFEEKHQEQIIYEDVSLKYSCNTTTSTSEEESDIVDESDIQHETSEDCYEEDNSPNNDQNNNDDVITMDGEEPLKQKRRRIPKLFKLLCQNRFIFVNIKLLTEQWRFVALALIMVLYLLIAE